MPLILIGVNHRTAPIEIREKLAFPANESVPLLHALRTGGSISEAVVVSTCNRTEVYLVDSMSNYRDNA